MGLTVIAVGNLKKEREKCGFLRKITTSYDIDMLTGITDKVLSL